MSGVSGALDKKNELCKYLKDGDFEFGGKVVPLSMFPMSFYHGTQIDHICVS